MDPEFTARFETPEPGIALARLAGRLYGTKDAYAFQDDASSRVHDSGEDLVLDLAEVTRIDSSGVGILAAIMTSCRRAGCRLALAALPPQVRRVLEASWLLRLVEVTPTAGEAVARLQHGVRDSGPAS